MNSELLVSDAAHFRVDYEINPYMHTEVQPDPSAAMAEHEAIVAAHRTAGRRVEYLPSVPECPDMVFTANAAVVRGNRAVLGNHRRSARRRFRTSGTGSSPVGSMSSTRPTRSADKGTRWRAETCC